MSALPDLLVSFGVFLKFLAIDIEAFLCTLLDYEYAYGQMPDADPYKKELGAHIGKIRLLLSTPEKVK